MNEEKMECEAETENDQLSDHILKLWNDELKESQQALIDLIRSLDQTTRQKVIQVLENAAEAGPRKDYRSKFE